MKYTQRRMENGAAARGSAPPGGCAAAAAGRGQVQSFAVPSRARPLAPHHFLNFDGH
jgi:hypothetical protein